MVIKNEILLYLGSVIITLWGIAHIIPTKSVVSDFEPTARANRLIITMEWIAEGLTLCFIGVLVGVVTRYGGAANQTSIIVYRLSAMMLMVMAVLTLATGAKTRIIAIKICPAVKAVVAVLFYLGSMG